ncbi:MAG: winged helix DNA-binding protein [Chloroflexi bacterium]|jgi:MarR family transcriptional regulator, organic hydroperoxide resistance regulator|nr:winged helix DNA-binding protein [Chloroflexota bacterium]MBT7082534.1 winged helix DNA-binding protein [Chloroflexota bacterium]MBT7290315.1 winged helix DNA-binding protein [Chloroflexota bacterium]
MVESEERLAKLLLVLNQVLTKVGVHRTITGSSMDLTNRQVGILETLLGKDNLTMKELAENMLIEQSAATRIVEGLVRKDLLERVLDGKDRRVIRINLTEKGRQIYNSVCTESSLLLSFVFEKMKPADQEALNRGLEVFIKAVHETEQQYLPCCLNASCKQFIDTNWKEE